MIDPGLTRLLQLTSPTLPVGAYTYSQGLEWAVEAGRVRDEATARAWIEALLRHPMAGFEAPLLAGLHAALRLGDEARVTELNDWYRVSRESGELRAETLQMGYSLAKLAQSLGEPPVPGVNAETCAFPTAWAWLSVRWGIGVAPSVTGYLWSWCENQVMAAVKLVPLGQTAGQRLLVGLAGLIPAIAEAAIGLEERHWQGFAPGLALASCGHESQYTRLFRS
ncbi:MAG: urease accessory protein UreF [Magnetococcales bacterium]|nr:urease accessory protein UreF [Magnetococcales bacterium]